MLFSSILSNITGTLTVKEALICTFVSLILGLVIAAAYMKSGEYNKNFVITLMILPAMVQIIIMLVNGNLGTSVAVLGAFGLVRFRSVPGSSREISSIFFAMAIGLSTGMGYLSYAVIITIILALIFIIAANISFGEQKKGKLLRITIPETLDYEDVFLDIFEKFTIFHELERVKTTNLGSMFELSYQIKLKPNIKEKGLIDEIRCRNGNLTVILSKQQTQNEEL